MKPVVLFNVLSAFGAFWGAGALIAWNAPLWHVVGAVVGGLVCLAVAKSESVKPR